MQVDQLAVVAQRLEAVRKAARDQQAAVVGSATAARHASARRSASPRAGRQPRRRPRHAGSCTNLFSACGGYWKCRPRTVPGWRERVVDLRRCADRRKPRRSSSAQNSAAKEAARIPRRRAAATCQAGDRGGMSSCRAPQAQQPHGARSGQADAGRCMSAPRLLVCGGAKRRVRVQRVAEAPARAASRAAPAPWRSRGAVVRASCGCGPRLALHIDRGPAGGPGVERPPGPVRHGFAGPKFQASAASPPVARSRRSRQQQVAGQRLQHVLPGPRGRGVADVERHGRRCGARTRSGIRRSSPQSPPPITLPARALASADRVAAPSSCDRKARGSWP